MKVVNHKVVTLEYTLRDATGQLIDSSDGKEPLSLIQGHGNVFSAVESAIEGHGMGERISLPLTPEQAYGERDPRLVRQVPRSQFRTSAEILPGMQFVRHVDGEEYIVSVIAANETTVSIDANHPLAGQHLQFELVITGIRDAIEEELNSGHIQQLDEIYAREAAATHSGELQ